MNGLHGDNSATFEQAFQRLQEVVQKLTEGNLTLEEALSSFEEGMALADTCTKMLDEAELRVKQVSARAARAAYEALDELEEAVPRSSPGAEDEVLSFEIESFEQHIIVDTARDGTIPGSPTGNLAYSPLPGERRPSRGAARTGMGSGGNPGDNGPSPAIGSPEELDPLFDEDD